MINAAERLEQNESILKSNLYADKQAVKNCYGAVLAFRVYAITTSQLHLEAGAGYQLQVSFDTMDQAQLYVSEQVADQVDFQFETYLIKS